MNSAEHADNAAIVLKDIDVYIVDSQLSGTEGASAGSILLSVLEQLMADSTGRGSVCYLCGSYTDLLNQPLAGDWIQYEETVSTPPQRRERSSSRSQGEEARPPLTVNATRRPANLPDIAIDRQASDSSEDLNATPVAENGKLKRSRLKRLDTSERLAEMLDGSSSAVQSRSPMPLNLNLAKSSMRSAPALHADSSHRANGNGSGAGMSLQELCRIQAKSPSTGTFDRTSSSLRSGRFADSQQSMQPPGTARAADEPEDFIVSCIIPNVLYLGPEPITTSDVDELQNLGVKQILNMALEIDDKPELGLARRFEKYVRLPMRDFVEETGVQKRIDEACSMLGVCLLICQDPTDSVCPRRCWTQI